MRAKRTNGSDLPRLTLDPELIQIHNRRHHKATQAIDSNNCYYYYKRTTISSNWSEIRIPKGAEKATSCTVTDLALSPYFPQQRRQQLHLQHLTISAEHRNSDCALFRA
ncbi:hypothetical protein AB1N83_014090 [Pleurotus pulmonarius]